MRLKVVVIEDHPSTLRLLRNHLLSAHAVAVETHKNGGKLLQSEGMVEVDLLILGMELENSYCGVDLVRQLSRLDKLPAWTKVFFITNQTFEVASNLPLLPLSCELFPKPINLHLLSQRIEALKPLNEYCRGVLGKLNAIVDRIFAGRIESI